MRHLLWELSEGDGYERFKEIAVSLTGLKVAPFYGCQILRPSKVLGFEDPDRPSSLERLIEACGAEAIDYPAKIKCCGFPIILAREDVALGEAILPLQEAADAGADVIVTPVPALPPVARRVAGEGREEGRPLVQHAGAAPRAAARRGGGHHGGRAQVQAPRRAAVPRDEAQAAAARRGPSCRRLTAAARATVRVAALADLHGRLDGVVVPPCDLVVIAGDLGPYALEAGAASQVPWLEGRLRALARSGWRPRRARRSPASPAITTSPWWDRRALERLPWTYLCDDEVTVAGARVYGSPWCPRRRVRPKADEPQPPSPDAAARAP